MVEVRSAFDYDAEAVSDSSGLLCEDDSKTVQADAEDADINVIVRRFGITHELPVNLRVPLTEEFDTLVTDYKSALDMLILADQAFLDMPADVRKRFNHDAGAFVEFASNPANLEEMRKLGLADPRAVALEPLEVRVVGDPVPVETP